MIRKTNALPNRFAKPIDRKEFRGAMPSCYFLSLFQSKSTEGVDEINIDDTFFKKQHLGHRPKRT